MNIPHWLFRLLPMWDYICPKCREKVSRTSHKCPFCNERYPSPLKVPPKLYKDRKALEQYVHKHILPKVSHEYRFYLTQFFTTLFAHGFEGGDFGTDPETGDAWTGTATSNGAAIVQSTTKHHGTYAAQFTITSSSGYARAYKNLGADYSTLFKRDYFYLSTLPANGQYVLLQRFENSAGAFIGDVGIINNAGIYYVYARYYSAGVQSATGGIPISISTDTPFCFETNFVIDASAGEVHVYVDGTESLAVTSKDTNDRGNIQIVHSEANIVGMTSITVICDCTVIADAYIGPESSVALQTVTDSFSLTDHIFRNKTLSIADSVGLQELLSGNKSLRLLGSLTAEDSVQVLKTLNVTDGLTLSEAVWTPSRLVRIDESVSLVELTSVGGVGAKKTKLFLVLGDLAIQLTGDQ
jgi:hypothetical protein